MTIQYLGDGNPDGTVLSNDGAGVTVGAASTSKLGFFGLATPIVQPVVTPVTTANKTTTLNELDILRLRTALVNLGLIATA